MLSLQEQITVRGVESLTDTQLLTYLLGADHSAEQQAQSIFEQYGGSIEKISSEDISRLRMIAGVGVKNAMLLKVAAEWGRRCSLSSVESMEIISSSADVVELFKPYFESMKYEECWVLFLSTSNKIVERYRVSQGGVMATVVDHRLIIKRALELLSTQIIMVHNHPSGAVEPSREDIDLTKKVKSAAALFDILLLDHIIMSKRAYFSFLSKGIL